MALLNPKKSEQEKPFQEEATNAPSDTIKVAGSGSAAAQNARNIPLIIGREFKAKVQKRSFAIATGILVVLVILAAFVPTIIELLTSNSQTKLVVVSNAGTVAGQDVIKYFDSRLNVNYDQNGNIKPLAAGKKPEFEIKAGQAGELDNLRKQVQDGKLDMVLNINRAANGELSFDYYGSGGPTSPSGIKIRSVATEMSFVDRLGRLNIPQNQLAGLFAQPQFKATSSTEEKSGRTPAETGAAYIIVLAGIILIFSTIQVYGQGVAQGATEEKSNRVMEIIVNAATPFQLMAGKIIGIGLAGIVQLGIMVIVGGAAFLAQGPIKDALLGNSSGGTSIDITGLSLSLLVVMLTYFILGFLLYSTIFAAVGSLVSRTEDLQNALGPLTFIFLAAYLGSIFGLNVPDASWVVVMSHIPFFSPTMMLMRVGMGSVAWWELPLNLVVMVVTIIIMFWLCSRVYRAGVLMYGQKPGFGKLLKLMVSR